MTEAVLIQTSDPMDTAPAALPRRLLAIRDAAENAMAWGLEFCAKKVGLDSPEAAVYHLQQGDDVAHAYCCYGLAQQIAQSLGSWDENVKAVYTLDYDATPEGLHLVYPLDYQATPKGPYAGEWTQGAPLLHLLVWTEHRTSTLDSLVADLDCALAQVYADATGTRGLTTLLDVQIIDEAYVEEQIDGGELCNWLYLRPTRLWRR